MYDQFSSSTKLLNEINYEINTTFIPKQVCLIRAVVSCCIGKHKRREGNNTRGSGLESGVWLAEMVDQFKTISASEAVFPGSVLLILSKDGPMIRDEGPRTSPHSL
jgi:hypothetical protein